MLAAVRGTVVATLPEGILLEMGPVTLQLAVSRTTLAALPRDGSPVRLATHLYVREDNLALYGFATERELGLFRVLLGVSGIGPQVALNVCGSGEPEAIIQAVAAGDVDSLARIPRIGKKTAARLVLELRGKLDALAAGVLAVPATGGTGPAEDTSEVVAALQALGYTTTEAFTALRDSDATPGMTVEERTFAALRWLGQQRG